jgi:GAF domain-containing protein
MKLPGSEWPAQRVRAWTAGLDALAAAGEAAVAATGEPDLMASTAEALADAFADWVIVDLPSARHASRSVAGSRSRPDIAAAVAGLEMTDSPVTILAVDRCTPLVQAEIADSSELGVLPDGQRVADALGAGSYAVSPIAVSGRALGAITIVRDRSSPPVTFLELNVLSHITDLAAAAIGRLDFHGETVHDPPGGRAQDGPGPPGPLA